MHIYKNLLYLMNISITILLISTVITLCYSKTQQKRYYEETSSIRKQHQKRKTHSHIINGENTRPGEFPFMVGLILNKDYKKLFCGGVVYDRDNILTSAYCLTGIDSSAELWLTIGNTDLEDDNESQSVLVKAESYKIHERYSSLPKYLGAYDLGVVKLNQSLNYTQYIQPLELPSDDEKDYEKQYVLALGWDITDVNDQNSVLQKVKLDVLDQTNCSIKSTKHKIHKTQICTLTAKKDTCQLDSGGPLVFKTPHETWELAGIIGYMTLCAEYDGYPTAHTRVTEMIVWIKDNTKYAEF